VYECV